MKRSELEQMIREEVGRALSEKTVPRIHGKKLSAAQIAARDTIGKKIISVLNSNKDNKKNKLRRALIKWADSNGVPIESEDDMKSYAWAMASRFAYLNKQFGVSSGKKSSGSGGSGGSDSPKKADSPKPKKAAAPKPKKADSPKPKKAATPTPKKKPTLTAKQLERERKLSLARKRKRELEAAKERGDRGKSVKSATGETKPKKAATPKPKKAATSKEKPADTRTDLEREREASRERMRQDPSRGTGYGRSPRAGSRGRSGARADEVKNVNLPSSKNRGNR
jgi:pyruvate/2-oxoglutarate dehydrogenase complex dihydrolipoamide acyltransferase (E2) component